MVMHKQYIIDSKGVRTGAVRPKAAILSRGDIKAHVKETSRCVAPATSALSFNSNTLKEIHPCPRLKTPICAGADTYLPIAAALKAPIISLDTPLCEYRQHENGKFFNELITLSGLEALTELQDAIGERLDIKNALTHNSYFCRNKYAYYRLKYGWVKSLAPLKSLLLAIAKDPHFTCISKSLMLTFWIVTMTLPKNLFLITWREFIRLQTGHKN
jgi:hypothetical protein